MFTLFDEAQKILPPTVLNYKLRNIVFAQKSTVGRPNTTPCQLRPLASPILGRVWLLNSEIAQEPGNLYGFLVIIAWLSMVVAVSVTKMVRCISFMCISNVILYLHFVK